MTQNILLLKQTQALLESSECFIANAANISAILFPSIPDLNWLGFYFLKGEDLILGPFSGKPACIILKKGRGVCQLAVEKKETVIVSDVHSFPSHIACDAESKSEMVVPLVYQNSVFGVLDIDSPIINRFGAEEKELFELCAQYYVESINIQNALAYYKA